MTNSHPVKPLRPLWTLWSPDPTIPSVDRLYCTYRNATCFHPSESVKPDWLKQVAVSRPADFIQLILVRSVSLPLSHIRYRSHPQSCILSRQCQRTVAFSFDCRCKNVILNYTIILAILVHHLKFQTKTYPLAFKKGTTSSQIAASPSQRNISKQSRMNSNT